MHRRVCIERFTLSPGITSDDRCLESFPNGMMLDVVCRRAGYERLADIATNKQKSLCDKHYDALYASKL